MASADAPQELLQCSSQGLCFPLPSDPGIRSAARPNPTRNTPILLNSELRRLAACWSSRQRWTCQRGHAIRLPCGPPGRVECPVDEPVGARRTQFVRNSPSLLTLTVQTALGIPGKSELTVSSTSSPCRSVRSILRDPRPLSVKI